MPSSELAAQSPTESKRPATKTFNKKKVMFLTFGPLWVPGRTPARWKDKDTAHSKYNANCLTQQMRTECRGKDWSHKAFRVCHSILAEEHKPSIAWRGRGGQRYLYKYKSTWEKWANESWWKETCLFRNWPSAMKIKMNMKMKKMKMKSCYIPSPLVTPVELFEVWVFKLQKVGQNWKTNALPPRHMRHKARYELLDGHWECLVEKVWGFESLISQCQTMKGFCRTF